MAVKVGCQRLKLHPACSTVSIDCLEWETFNSCMSAETPKAWLIRVMLFILLLKLSKMVAHRQPLIKTPAVAIRALDV